ncbi:MAG: hypothetical protein KF819_26650 [Labilithrix sp.]|nr:hypothetical protein [Labilithrix sp.]
MLLRTSVALFALALAGCPSGEGAAPGPQAPVNTGVGPLASLEESPFLNEVWSVEGTGDAPFLYYPRENVRVSGPCRLAGGQLACEAMQFVRNGMPVSIPRRELDGRASGGVKVCLKLNMTTVFLRNSVGAEETMCRFNDGSMISTTALEQYAMNVL